MILSWKRLVCRILAAVIVFFAARSGAAGEALEFEPRAQELTGKSAPLIGGLEIEDGGPVIHSHAAVGFSEYIEANDVDFVIYRSDDNRWYKICSGEEKIELSPREALELATGDLNRLADACTIDHLVDFLWHHQQLDDPPGSYSHIIALQKRAIEIDPGFRQQYFDTAWLLYSQWVLWKNYPERTPSRESNIREAIEVLEKGSEEFSNSAEYHYFAALTIDPKGHHDIPGMNEFAGKMLIKADELAGEDEEKLKIRARLMLGINFRRRAMDEEAVKWFRKILELDPEHRAAQQYLEEI